jgi:phospholipid/cholesterol/gamma-HCH transport system substrate-binding protein
VSTRTTYLRAGVAAAVGAVLLSGCGPTLGDLPLPGTGVSGDTIKLEADFDEALNLSQGAIVKVNGVDAGRVQSVSVQDFQAKAELLVRKDANVRDGATARLRYNTPLGELFVDVTNPVKGQTLTDGAVLTDKVTDTAPTVEDALASASLLINGGGLDQLQNVTQELNTILGGREDKVRDLLDQSNVFLGQANATTSDIGRTLESLNTVAKILAARHDTIKRALTEFRPASEVLRKSTEDITRLLQALQKFSGNANSIVHATRTQILHLINESSPVLKEFNSNGRRFGSSLMNLVHLAKTLDGVAPGDYANLGIILPLDMTALPGIGTLPVPGGGGGGGGIPGLPPIPGVPTIPGLPPIPTIPSIPGLRPIPGLPRTAAAYDAIRLEALLGGQR